jgi:hypothetical protein
MFSKTVSISVVIKVISSRNGVTVVVGVIEVVVVSYVVVATGVVEETDSEVVVEVAVAELIVALVVVTFGTTETSIHFPFL